MGAQPPSKVRAVAQHWQGGVLHNTSNTSMSRALKLIMLCMKGRHACAAPETRAAQGVMHTAGAHKLHTAAQTTSIHISFASSIFSCNDSEVVVEPSLQSRYEEILDRFSLGKNLRARARARTQTHGAKPSRAEPSRAEPVSLSSCGVVDFVGDFEAELEKEAEAQRRMRMRRQRQRQSSG